MGNIHEQIERFASQSPRTKVIAAACVLLAVAGAFAFVFYLGVRSAEGWAESKYLRERENRMVEVAFHQENERQLAAENALLRKQNEAVAEILTAGDKQRAADAARRFAELQAMKNERMHEIDVDASFDSQICQLCLEAAAAGFPLSAQFCSRCK